MSPTRIFPFHFHGGFFQRGNYDNFLQFVDCLPSKEHPILLLGCREEDSSPSDYHEQVLALQDHIRSKGMYLYLLLNWNTQYTGQTMPGVDYHYVDFMLLHTVYNNPMPVGARDHSRGILFLIGKPESPHRAPLLFRFFERDQLADITWSLHVPSHLQERVRQLIPHASDLQWQQFLALQRSPDAADIHYKGDSIHVANYAVTNPVLYASTAMSLVSETMWASEQRLAARATEKTYKSIDNHHPFVIAGPPGTLGNLRQLGYQTYEQWLPYPDYDNERDHGARLEMVYENTLALHEVAINGHDLVPVAEHNYRVNRQRYQQEIGRIDSVLARYGSDRSALQVLPLHDQLVGQDQGLRLI